MNKLLLTLPVLLLPISLQSCGYRADVLIYHALDELRADFFQEQLNAKFPNHNIIMQNLSTGTLVSRLMVEGKRSIADIVLALEMTDTEKILDTQKDIFADLSDYDTSMYDPSVLEYQERHKFYHIEEKLGGCIILNSKVLSDNNLPEPNSYQDLLNPIYKNMIIMPNPKSSGTGYIFYRSLIENMGLDAALDYFSQLANNVKEFSTSGSGPVKGCDRGEIAIGLGMTYQAADYINSNPDLKIKFFEEGSPFSFYTMAMINGKEKDPFVKAVYDYIYYDINYIDKKKYSPDTIYTKEYLNEIELKNFPQDVKYSKMGNQYDFKYKSELIDKWKW